ncbi:MAG TPA: nucleotidyltransferase domain-containing protein, partial [Opitutus sp.]|nr:nucleotidyltransferase domain-containing protein [Opitutus sp.]
MSATTSTATDGLLAFTAGATPAERLAACKAYLKAEWTALHERHSAGASGLEIVAMRAASMDRMLARLFDHAAAHYLHAHGSLPALVALVALGGYGRGELSPLSDIDVMFLFPAKTKLAGLKPFLEHLTNEILYPLWDCGLKVGYSMRTIDEVFVEARKDIQTLTSLLEARQIAGSTNLFNTFAQAYRAFSTSEDPKGYIAARLEDQAQRRAKYGQTVFLQEPDLKNGVGGLRDYQNAVWMARVKLGITTIDELVTQNYLRPEELAEFNRAYDFLLRVRNELHFLSARATDLLDLDHQPRVALHLGYDDRNLLARVENFMQDYYRSAQTIFRVSQLVESRLALAIGRDASGAKLSLRDTLRASRFRRSKRFDGLVLRGRNLAAEGPDIFTQDPVRLIRVFRHQQQLECALDFHLAALIRESLPLLTDAVRHSHEANVAFRAILSEPGAVFPTLNQMHELGVLRAFIPEFDGLT